MFGLMKFRAKAPSALPAQHQRLHYCGVCKAMGRQYGQRTRAMLNYDAIFLSELLTFLGPAPANYHSEWSPALLSYNCLRLPKEEDLPESLKYAAAVNVLLAGVKLEDNVQDRGGFLWRTASKFYSERVEKAENDLRGYGLDLEAVDGWLREHARREQGDVKGGAKQHLEWMAEATAEITAMVFRQGAAVMGRGEEQGKMAMLGRDFGKMIYLLDAWRDFEKDGKKGEYNPIRVAWGVEGREMPMAVREEMQGKLLQTGRFMLETMEALPFTEPQKTWFRDRIEENLREQLGLSVEEVRACTTAPAKKPRRKISLATRWQFLNNLARTWHLPKIRNRSGYWRTAFTFGSVGLLALLFPSFLHAKADWFTHIDPDFLSRFGDLHPDWINETANDCCCQGPNGRCCCDTCCNNCTRECNETCDRIITIFLTIVALFAVGIVTMVVFIIQGRRRAARKEAERHNANLAQEPRQNNFRTVLHRPGRDTEVLLAGAHDWFQRHIPGSMPQLTQSENHRTLYARGRINARKQVLGQIEFLAKIHVREGALALEFEEFEHVGGPECLAGGPLSQRIPARMERPMTAQAWGAIKDQVATEVRALLGSFGSEI